LTNPIKLTIRETSHFSTKVLPTLQKAGASHHHEENTNQDAVGKSQHAMPEKTKITISCLKQKTEHSLCRVFL